MKILFVLVLTVVSTTAQTTPMPMTGREVPSLVPYENALKPILQKWSIPGAALAISDGGRLVYARGFGYADKEAGIPVQPASLFRFASISKTLTGMTIVKLAEEGRLNLDSKFMDIIPNITPIPTLAFDSRMRNITIRMLLQHTGGWDKDVPNDWVLQFTSASKALGVPYATLTPDMMCRWAISQKLDFEPGTRYAYSQSGYLILGRIIEKITGKKYEDAVREKLLTPAGVTTIKLGHSLLSQREPDEVKYYDYPGAPLQTGTPVVPGAVAPTPRQYGNYWVEQAESYGGWMGNTIDLLKYINTLEGRRGPAVLNAASLASIVVRPSITPTGEYVGLTWRIDQVTGGAHWWHSGGATGTRNILARRQNNRDWVVLMNSRPLDEDTIISEIFSAFAKAETQVTSWPANDLFPDFGGSTLSTSAQSLNFTYASGGALPEGQTVQLTAAPANVNFTVATPSTATWLTLDKVSGATPAAVRVSVNPAGLAPGSYTAAITVAAPQSANGSRSIPVTLKVTEVAGFTAVRNSASRLAATAAAPGSRLVIEIADLSGEATVKFTDSASVEKTAEIVEASAGRVDIVVPSDLQPGDASISVTNAAGRLWKDALQISPVTPGLFTASGEGTGVPLGSVIVVDSDGNAASTPVYDCSSGACVGVPIDLGPESSTVTLQLAATGVRSQGDVGAYAVAIGDQLATVTAVEISPTALGVDLITISLQRSLIGLGEVELTVSVDGKTSNAVKVSFL